MKRPFLVGMICLTFLAGSHISAQAPDSTDKDEQELAALVKALQAQQAEIADNQSKIEAKLADLGETIRVARLFAGKAGK
jgi:hypothetical protein